MADKNSTSPLGTISQEGEESNTPQYVTQEQLNQALNGFRKSSKKDLETAIKEALAPLASLTNREVESENAPTAPAKGKVDPEKEEMKKQLKILMDREQAREAELAEQKLNSSLRDSFTKHGVDPRHVDHAISYVKHSKLVKHDEDGNLVMKVNQIDMPLQDAMTHWVKTDDAKLYLAPRGTQGSGQRGAVRAPDTNTSAQPNFSKDNIGDLLLGELMKQ